MRFWNLILDLLRELMIKYLFRALVKFLRPERGQYFNSLLNSRRRPLRLLVDFF